jgi:hypothetical protein
MPHDINSRPSFEALPLNLNGHRKTWVHTTGYHSSTKLQARDALLHFPVEPSGTRHCNQIDEDQHQADLRLGMRETLGLPPLFDQASSPHATSRRHTRRWSSLPRQNQARSCLLAASSDRIRVRQNSCMAKLFEQVTNLAELSIQFDGSLHNLRVFQLLCSNASTILPGMEFCYTIFQ